MQTVPGKQKVAEELPQWITSTLGANTVYRDLPQLAEQLSPEELDKIIHALRAHCLRSSSQLQSLSSLINDPRAKTEWSIYDYFYETTPVPPQLTPLEDIQTSDFRDYVQSIQEKWKSFEKIRKIQKHYQKQYQARLEVPTPELLGVPEIFFDPNFSLARTDYFTQLIDPNNPMNHYDTYAQYLDTVEIELSKQISRRSASFFSALSSLQQLNGEVQKICERISVTRSKLAAIDNVMVREPLHIAQLRRKKANLLGLYRKLKLISTIRQTQPTIQLLLSTSDFAGAIELISTAQEVLRTELAGVQSFKHLGLQLEEMSSLIEKMMMADFLQSSVLGSDSGLPYDHLPDSLEPTIHGLLKMGKLLVGLQTYKEQILNELKMSFKEVIADHFILFNQTGRISLPTDNSGDKRKTADLIKELAQEDFLTLISAIFSRFTQIVQRALSIHQLICSILDRMKAAETVSKDIGVQMKTEDFQSPAYQAANGNIDDSALATMKYNSLIAYYDKVMQDSQDILQGTAEHAHGHCTRIIHYRTDIHSRLSHREFSNSYYCCLKFAQATEKIAGKSIASLRNRLLLQAKAFLEHYHQKKMSTITNTLEQEIWSQADVPHEYQQIFQKLAAPMKPLSEDESEPGYHSDDEHGASETTLGASSKVLVIDGLSYPTVGSVLMLLHILYTYKKILLDFPFLVTDILQRTIELLKVFNSRTCQLVLGAGALQIAGLKSITASHLALSSQVVSTLILLVPIFKRNLQQRLTTKQMVLLSDFDRVEQDCNEHRQEIFSKLNAIMRDALETLCKGIQELPWSDDSQPKPNDYMKKLTKKIITLHKLLNPILQKAQMQLVFSRIITTYNSRLISLFSDCDMTTTISRARLLADIQHFNQCVESLENVQASASLTEWYHTKFLAQSNTSQAKS